MQHSKPAAVTSWYPEFTRTLPNGRALAAHIAPYSIGMKSLVVDISEAQERGRGIVAERVTLDLGSADIHSDEDLLAALGMAMDMAPVKWVACVRCGTERLDVTQTNRYESKPGRFKAKKGQERSIYDHLDLSRPLCEKCFLAILDKDWEEAVKKELAAEAKAEKKLIAQGFTHKVAAWIHPKAGGDDRQIAFYSKGEMTETQIKALLRRRGSSRLDDWKQTPIEGANVASPGAAVGGVA